MLFPRILKILLNHENTITYLLDFFFLWKLKVLCQCFIWKGIHTPPPSPQPRAGWEGVCFQLSSPLTDSDKPSWGTLLESLYMGGVLWTWTAWIQKKKVETAILCRNFLNNKCGLTTAIYHRERKDREKSLTYKALSVGRSGERIPYIGTLRNNSDL